MKTFRIQPEGWLLTGSGELELKVFLPKKGDGFIETSQAEAGEVLDVHAVEFSKTSAFAGRTKKASNSHGRPWGRSDTRSYQASAVGLSVVSWVAVFRAAVWTAEQ